MKKANKMAVASMLALALLCSCSGNKKDNRSVASEFLRPASVEYSGKDTAQINDLVQNYIAALSNKQLDKASDMLFTLRNDSIFPLDADSKQGFINAYTNMPIHKCKDMGLTLRSEKNNSVKLAIQVAKGGDIDKNIGVTYIYLNPVKVGGQWYLTLLDKNAEGVEDVYEAKN